MGVYGRYLIYFAAAFFLRKTAANTQSMILMGAGGIERGLNLKQVGEWLLFLAPALFSAGSRLEKELASGAGTIVRFQKKRRWWKHLVVRNLSDLIVYLCIVSLVFSGVFPDKWTRGAYGFCYLMLIVNFSFLSCCMYLIRSSGVTMVAAMLGTLLAVGIGIYFWAEKNVWNQWFFGFWGMFRYSSLYRTEGFDVRMVCSVQIAGAGIAVGILGRNAVWERLT